jgi:cell division protein FtsL
MTPQEFDVLWKVVIQTGAAVALIVAIIKGIQYLFSLTSVAKLQTKVTDQDNQLKKMEKHLSDIDCQINEMQETREKESRVIDKSLKMLGVSLTAIINHMIDTSSPNENKENKEDMIRVRDDMSNFFINK